MGMMVLYADDPDALHLLRHQGRVVGGMEITGDDGRFAFRDLLKERHALAMEVSCLRSLQVSDVGAQKSEVVFQNAEGRFHLRSQGENLGITFPQDERFRGVASGTTQYRSLAGRDSCDRIVTPDQDVPVVDEEKIGDALQPMDGFAVPDADGLVNLVGACHDERLKRFLQEKMVKRRVGKHDPLVGHARSHGRRDQSAVFFLCQDNGPLGREEKVSFFFPELGDPCRRIQIPHHEGEGFFLSELPGTEPLNRFIARCVHGQVESAETLQGKHASLAKCFPGPRDGIGDRKSLSRFVKKFQAGPANGTGVGLGVKAAVGRMFVLSTAQRAQGKAVHGGIHAVVGHIPDDREPRAAVRAVDEGISVAPVAGIEKFLQAVGTGGEVRRDADDLFSLRLACQDLKIAVSLRGDIYGGDLGDLGVRRALSRNSRQESLNGLHRAFHFRNNAV